MTDFLNAFTLQISTLWATHYLPLLVVSSALTFALRHVTRGMLRVTACTVVLFLLLLVGAAIAGVSGSAKIAGILHGVAVLLLGMLLIRQLGLLFFRLIIPKLGFRPPRILEEILILFAYVAWLLVRLSIIGLDLSSLVASTAVVTAVLAFAMQDTLGNILAGLALQLDHSIHIGDWVELEDISGQVTQVQWRHTAVRTLFGEMILIPNSQLMKARVTMTGGPTVPRRLRTVYFYCDFAIRPAVVIKAIEQALIDAEFEAIAADTAPTCLVTDFAGGITTYAVRYWLIDPLAIGRTESLVRQHIHAVFQQNGWTMAAPGRAVTLERRPPQVMQQVDAAQRISFLKEISLFSPLTDEELNNLADRLEVVPYVAGSLIARQDDMGDCLYILITGSASVWLETPAGRHLLAELGPGEVVGEMSLMTGERRRATVTARDDVVCYRLGKHDFQAVLQQRPELADAFAQMLAVRKQELHGLRDSVPATAVQTEKAAILARIRGLFRL